MKKEEDDKAKADQKPGNSSKGGNTPLGKQKAAENAKKGKNLKRPGSPNLSESSGNESSRKKHKKQATGSAQPSRSSTPVPGSQRASMGAGATSDGEATGGEMSDGGRSKKPKVKKVGTHSQGTPSGSRAGSPAPAPGQLSPGKYTSSHLIVTAPFTFEFFQTTNLYDNRPRLAQQTWTVNAESGFTGHTSRCSGNCGGSGC